MTTLAMITGASRGIGAGIAAAATADDAIVATVSRGATDAPHGLQVDLADPTAWDRVIEWYDGVVDAVQPDQIVVVHNAATLTPIGFAGEVDPVGYRSAVLLNSAVPQVIGDAVIRTARRVATPTVVVQLSSGAGSNPYPGWTGYCAAKAAVDMWVRTVGVEQAERRDLVRAVAVSPGVVATEMQAEIRSSDADAFPNVERFREMERSGALADPAQVGAAIWALALDDGWENGAVTDLRSAP